MFSAKIVQTANGPQLNMRLTAGDEAKPVLTVSIDSEPLDLTGYTVKMTIAIASGNIVLNTNNSGITINNPQAGQFTINMLTPDTADWDPGVWPYDIWLESQTSPPIENQYVVGQFTVNPSITSVP